MAQILPRELTPIPGGTINPSAAIIVDNEDGVFKATPANVADAGAPINSQPQAEAGLVNTGRMTPLRTAQAIAALGLSQAVLASTIGGGMVGTADGGDVQTELDALNETAASLLDLATVISVTSATALDTDDLNKTVIVSGSASFTLNLPAASAIGQALKLYCARTYTGRLTIQSSVSSPTTVDGVSELDFMAGESGTFVFDGTGWIVLDRVFVPIVAQMISAASDFAVGTTFDEPPMSVAGTQMMRNDVRALWNYSSGYFRAPRSGVYRVGTMLWAQHANGGGAGFYDVGAYVGSATGGTPSGKNFMRFIVGDLGAAAFESLAYSDTFFMNKGENLYLSVEASASLVTPKIVSSGTLESALNIVEIRV